MKRKVPHISSMVTAGCILLFAPFFGFAQADIHLSQFYETTILRNPALTGVFAGNYKVEAYYRTQWSSVAKPYETMMLNGEYRIALSRFSDDFLSLGILAYADKAGDIDQKISAFYPAINYNKSLNPDNNSYLSFGFTGGYLQFSFDPALATFNNQFQGGVFDPNNPTFENLPTPKRSIYDVGAGINYNLSPGSESEATYVIGASVYHFNSPVYSYYNGSTRVENTRLNINAGMVRDITTNFVAQLHLNYAQQGTYREMIGGALIGWRSIAPYEEPSFEIYAGAMYRVNDAVIPVMKLKYKAMALGLSYDVNMSSLKKASHMEGGFEITLSATGFFPKDRREYKKTVCPRF